MTLNRKKNWLLTFFFSNFDFCLEVIILKFIQKIAETIRRTWFDGVRKAMKKKGRKPRQTKMEGNLGKWKAMSDAKS